MIAQTVFDMIEKEMGPQEFQARYPNAGDWIQIIAKATRLVGECEASANARWQWCRLAIQMDSRNAERRGK